MARNSRPPAFGGRYAGSVAVVTGASAGLGAQLSRDLARAGATVVGLARSEDRLALLSTELQDDSPKSGTVVCDVADTAALREALDQVVATHGPIDLLVNNAAQDPGVRLVDIGEQDFRHIFNVNFFAPVAATLHVMPSMVERGRGTVVMVSSDMPELMGVCHRIVVFSKDRIVGELQRSEFNQERILSLAYQEYVRS